MSDTSDMNAKVDWLWTPVDWFTGICPELMQLDLEPFFSCGILWWFLTTPKVIKILHFKSAGQHQFKEHWHDVASQQGGFDSNSSGFKALGIIYDFSSINLNHPFQQRYHPNPNPWHHHPTSILHVSSHWQISNEWHQPAQVIACGEKHSVAATFDEDFLEAWRFTPCPAGTGCKWM